MNDSESQISNLKLDGNSLWFQKSHNIFTRITLGIHGSRNLDNPLVRSNYPNESKIQLKNDSLGIFMIHFIRNIYISESLNLNINSRKLV